MNKRQANKIIDRNWTTENDCYVLQGLRNRNNIPHERYLFWKAIHKLHLKYEILYNETTAHILNPEKLKKRNIGWQA